MVPLPLTVSWLEQGLREQLHLGAQVYLSRDGVVLADLALGEAQPGVPLQQDTLMLWLSSVKPITAVAVAQLKDRGQLDWDDPISRYITEFGQGGKAGITVRHLLTHTGAFRTADKCDLGASWPEIIECICRAPLEPGRIPGAHAAYHVSSSWYILGELVHRLDGRPLEQYAQEQIFRPCQMPESRLVVSLDEFERLGPRLGQIFHTEKGALSPHHRWNTSADSRICRPGRNGRGPIRELGRFYEALLGLVQGTMAAGDGPPILTPETARELTRRQRVGLFDDTFQHIIDWGLGFCLDSKQYGGETVPYNYGRYCSDRTFGHSGAQSSCAFADPDHALVVAWACNGMPGERMHQRRARELNSAIYEDLGLT